MYVFDLDGTLVESVDAHVAAWLEALRLMGVERRYEEVKPLMGLPARDIAAALFPERAAELAALKNRLFLERYLALVRPYEDVSALERLPRPIAVVTSSSGYVARRVIEAAGLSHLVDFVLGGDEVPRGKPAPDPLYVVGQRFSVDTRDMVVVGDSEYDMRMAEEAGAYGICIARRGVCRGARRVIYSLFEL
ncbi:HAD family hydrolase [Pyrobaculum neutrophilum]|uniref:HAD-superfamily hydrolase, subfamily IA, variant 3 n=1 Tax=Pyrobaculum neutrophilum (strain DSM 2338 / JCM 9278 / NBRC 100436 / V24Sta) TaxID=444157 RepID=B1Y9C3_PYRNV|nr:HAD-IA family hydrolase [Pyrobaculum neutrophilum]ACB40352.1 HAD-superfamily hydrolase, subfamily IA, variant 3 [Pyrobaculum neutrophilum V24Sta]